MILVVGATGMLGGEVAARLAAGGRGVRGLVRPGADAGKVARLRGMGVETVTGDLRDRASLDAACRGVDAVICTASSIPFAYAPETNDPHTTDRDGVICLVDAARGNGVGRFVYTSFTPYPDAFPLQDAKRAVEAHLAQNGMTYTVLQPTYFTEVWLSPAAGFDFSTRKATVAGNGTGRISYISFRDVAQFAVGSLDNPAARNATLLLGGPEALSLLDVIGLFERVGGAPWEYVKAPVEALRAQADGAADPMQKSFATLMLDYANDQPVDMRETLRAFPLTLSTVEEYARQVTANARAGVAAPPA